MGRELRRKEAKRQGKNVKEVQNTNKENLITSKKFITIMIVVLALFILTYLFTGIITNDIKLFSKDSTSSEKSASNIKNKILASESLKQSEEDYYVYYYDITKENIEVTDAVNYLTDTVYRVDLNDAFNANFIGEPSGVVDTIENLKVSDPTVIKVSSERIVSFYSGIDEIKSLK